VIARCAEAFMLGLATGPVCLAYCAPVLAPLIVSVDEPHRYSRTGRLVALFLLGRLAGYLCVGLLAGLVGSRIFEPGATPGWAVTLLMGITLLVFGVLKSFPTLRLCRMWPAGRGSAGWGVLLGLLTGLSICPPFVVAVASSTLAGSVTGSVLYFAAFFSGTMLYVPPLMLLGPLSSRVPFNQVAKGCLLLSGIWFLWRGLMEGLTQLGF
jgi:sulfite exporter TauE/SafE